MKNSAKDRGFYLQISGSGLLLLPERAFGDTGCDGGDNIKVHEEDRGPELRGDEEPSAGTFADETGPWGWFEQDRGSCGWDPVR